MLAVFCAACNNAPKQSEEDKNLLPTNLVNNPNSADGQGTDKSKLPVLTIPDSTHDFGQLSDGEKVEQEFPFTNTGAGPLILSGADAGCGCTVTDYPRDPVLPGKGGIFKVSFNSAGKIGHQEKAVTILSNAANGTRHITITAEVAKAK